MRKRVVAVGAAVVLALGGAGVAQTPMTPPKLEGSTQNFFKMRKRVAVPAYQVTFITQQQGTAVASIAARTRLNLQLVGVDEAVMRRLADEGLADLTARFKAAGFDVAPQAEARAMAAGVEAIPGNTDTVAVGPSITIGKSVKIGWTAVGAREAPLLKPFHNPSGQPMGMMSMFGGAQKVGAAARQADAVAVIPALVIDFADMEGKTGGDFLGRPAAGVDAALRFGLRYSSATTVTSGGDRGPAYAGGLTMRRDWNLSGPFATVQQGGAAVRQGSMGAIADSNFILRDRARGDAVVVDLPVWERMAKEAIGAYNAAVVEAAVKGRG